jgi:hypothetical protein
MQGESRKRIADLMHVPGLDRKRHTRSGEDLKPTIHH